MWREIFLAELFPKAIRHSKCQTKHKTNGMDSLCGYYISTSEQFSGVNVSGVCKQQSGSETSGQNEKKESVP